MRSPLGHGLQGQAAALRAARIGRLDARANQQNALKSWKLISISSLWDRTRAAQAQLSERDRLFAVWLGVAAVVIHARLHLLESAQPMFHPEPFLMPWLPIAAYEDVLLVALLSWISWDILPMLRRPGVRRAAFVAASVVALLVAAYAALNVELYNYFQGSLTYQLLALSSHLEYIRDTIWYFTKKWNYLPDILLAPVHAIAIALAIYWLVPGLLGRAARVFHSPLGAGCLACYVLAGFFWGAHWRAYQSAFQNPEWAFLKSLGDHNDEAFVAGKFPSDYLNDFMPAQPGTAAAAAGASAGLATTSAGKGWRPKNVVMLIGESLGSKYLGLYGAPYADSPEMEQLAQHGALFQRAYVSCPYSDNAIAALFTSVYLYHYWEATLTHAPRLSISGIGTVLQNKGYRVAFIHSGQLASRERRYLLAHGFPEVHDKADPPGFPLTPGPFKRSVLPQDTRLVPSAMNWIGADRSKPFFVVLWTDDTHMPYTPPALKSFGSSDNDLNRYRSAAEETDSEVGLLERGLAARGLLDDTIVMVTGDHGEQFGQHGHLGHGWSLYEEEVRIPLIIANPRLFPHEEKIDRLARQIDLAPTILAMLGFDEPADWQGQDLFNGGPERRAYLFADYHYGLVDGNYKYIYDVTSGYSEIYDLSRDPLELNNLSDDPAVSVPAKEAYMRMAAWSAFQNKYLDKFDLLHH